MFYHWLLCLKLLQKKSINSFKLDPAHDLSTSCGKDVIITFTDVNLNLISDIKKYHSIKNIKLGGLFLWFVRVMLKLTMNYLNCMILANQKHGSLVKMPIIYIDTRRCNLFKYLICSSRKNQFRQCSWRWSNRVFFRRWSLLSWWIAAFAQWLSFWSRQSKSNKRNAVWISISNHRI